jgi:hypothetical protein
LSEAIPGKTVHGRKVQVRLKKAGEDLRDCQIVFIGASESPRFVQILDTLRGAHVLAVGESEGFLEAGGTLNFVMEGERVRFDANLAAATRENLRISSQLLMMARVVLNEPAAPKISNLESWQGVFADSTPARDQTSRRIINNAAKVFESNHTDDFPEERKAA